MRVPTSMLVALEMRKVPKGRLITATQLRDRLARAARADLTCPMTTGIFFEHRRGREGHRISTGRVMGLERALAAR
jgi:hypothetical protein